MTGICLTTGYLHDMRDEECTAEERSWRNRKVSIGAHRALCIVRYEVHSVVTFVSPPVTAAFRVCHESVAHLIRLGCSRTPANTASLPSPLVSGGASGSEVTSW